MYGYFIEQEHKLLRHGGKFGMIVSNKFLRSNYGRPLRRFLRREGTVERVVDFAGLPVFAGATVRTIVLLTSRRNGTPANMEYSPPLDADLFEAVTSGRMSVDEAIRGRSFHVSPPSIEGEAWGFANPDVSTLLEKLRNNGQRLFDYCGGRICMGVKSGLTEAFVIDRSTRDRLIKRNKKSAEIIKPFVNGRDIRRYQIVSPDAFLIYTYHGVPIGRYPQVEEHLRPYKARLCARATKQEWYELQQPQFRFSTYLDGPKIVFPDISTEPRFALDEEGYYGSNTIYFIPGRDLFLLALLNSSVANLYFVQTCAGLEGKNEIYLRFFGQYLEGFPVATIDSTNQTACERKSQIENLVQQILSLHTKLAATKPGHARTVLERQIEATDRQIDQLVYQLYGLTDDEIALVESATK